MGRNARPRRGAASSGPATAAAPPKKSITTKQRASKNTGQKTSAQAGRVSKNIHVPKKKRDEEPDDEELRGSMDVYCWSVAERGMRKP